MSQLNIAALLALLSTLEGATPLHDAPVEINGHILVDLNDGNKVYEEGVRQNNALVMPEMRQTLRNQDVTVMSMRNALTQESVLSLSVSSDQVVRHVVGKHNAAPSADQLDTLYKLLVEKGIELQYNPFSLY